MPAGTWFYEQTATGGLEDSRDWPALPGSHPATSNVTSDEETLVSKPGGALRAKHPICPHSARQREQTWRNTHRTADG